MVAEISGPVETPKDTARRGTLLFRAPSPSIAFAAIVALSAALAAVLWWPNTTLFLEGFGLVFALPALLAAVLTTPLARALRRVGARNAAFPTARSIAPSRTTSRTG